MQRELDLLVAKRTNAYDAVMVSTAYPKVYQRVP